MGLRPIHSDEDQCRLLSRLLREPEEFCSVLMGRFYVPSRRHGGRLQLTEQLSVAGPVQAMAYDGSNMVPIDPPHGRAAERIGQRCAPPTAADRSEANSSVPVHLDVSHGVRAHLSCDVRRDVTDASGGTTPYEMDAGPTSGPEGSNDRAKGRPRSGNPKHGEVARRCRPSEAGCAAWLSRSPCSRELPRPRRCRPGGRHSR